MIVVDASVLIGHLDENDPHHARAEQALLRSRRPTTLACSPITLAEMLFGPARRDRLDAARATIVELGVEVIPSRSQRRSGWLRCAPTPA